MPAYDGTQTSPVYQPAVRAITNITQANPAVVTTSVPHNYTDTDIVVIYIPSGFGMRQLNEAQGNITVIDTTSFYFPVDTTQMDAFAVADNGQLAQVIGLAEDNTTRGPFYNTLPRRVRTF